MKETKEQEEQESHYRESWWIEHLEDEIEPNLKEDLGLLLKNSKSDREILESLKRTRRLLKESDDVVLPESGLYYRDLHSRIMSAIEEEIEAPRSALPAIMRRNRVNWPSVFGALGVSMMVALVSMVSLKTVKTLEADPNHQTSSVEEAMDDFQAGPGFKTASLSADLMGFQSESDFLMDAAAERLQSMNPAEVEALLHSLK